MLSNGTLLVSGVSETDVGWYHCRGRRTGDAGAPQVYSAQLVLACESAGNGHWDCGRGDLLERCGGDLLERDARCAAVLIS